MSRNEHREDIDWEFVSLVTDTHACEPDAEISR